MKKLLLLLAAGQFAGAQPGVPAVDYVVPAAVQPFASDPATIWYDSFDDPGALDRYLEKISTPDLFYLTSEQAYGGAGLSLKGLFREGTVSAGSLKVAFGDSPLARVQARTGEKFTEIYWRIYVKHQRGWTGNPAKLSRATILAGANWSQAMIAHVWGAGNATPFLTLDPATGIDAAGRLATVKYNDFDHLRWLGYKPFGEYPVFATPESGKWVSVEAAARLNTPGASDGTFRLWIDGRLDAFRDGLNWRGTWDERGINAVFLENYWNDGSPVEQARYFDDFVVSTRPIGLARAPLNPEIVKTTFESADGGMQGAFEVQVATACELETVWQSGAIAGEGNRVTVDGQNGLFRGPLEGAAALAPDTRYAARARQGDRAGRWSEWSPWRVVIHTVAEGAAENAGRAHVMVEPRKVQK